MTAIETIQDDALRLLELDRTIVRALHENNDETLQSALTQYFELRKSLKTHVMDRSAIQFTDADAKLVIQKITTGEGLISDKIIEKLTDGRRTELSDDDFEDEELWELGSDLFYSWISHYEYILGLAELRPLILLATCPESVSRLIAQIRNCYAFQQYDAAFSLCRVVIEAAARDISLQCRLFPEMTDEEILYEKLSWSKLRDRVSSAPRRERLRQLYANLSEVIHSRKSVSKEEVRGTFEETLQVIEQLYAENNP